MRKVKRNEGKKPIVAFALSVNEKKLVEEEAKKMGLSLSAYIRYRLLYERREA